MDEMHMMRCHFLEYFIINRDMWKSVQERDAT